MSDHEHRDRWADEIAAYALDALDDAEVALVESHLAECEECTERLRWLSPAIDVLPATVAQQEPPPALRSRLMDVVEREGAQPAGVASPPKRSWSERLGLSGLALRPALAGLAVLLIVAAGVAGYIARDGDTDATSYAARGVGEGKMAHGTLEVDGDQGSLTVANLPPTGPGQVYQAWVQDSPEHGGAVHPSSVFVVSSDGSGSVMIPDGLSQAERVMVTREPEGGSEKPHESSLITAKLD